MSIELGLSVGMTLIAFTFAYLSVNEKDVFKWLYMMFCFGFLMASTDVFRRLATDGGLDANIIGMFDVLTMVLIVLFTLMVFVLFIIVLQKAIEMWMPKKKSFREE